MRCAAGMGRKEDLLPRLEVPRTRDFASHAKRRRMMTQPSPIPEFFKAIHEPLAAAGAVQRVFGAPVQSGQRTVIPVARVSWGFGGGSGRNFGPRKVEEGQKEERRPPGEGGGGGGGIQIKPL